MDNIREQIIKMLQINFIQKHQNDYQDTADQILALFKPVGSDKNFTAGELDELFKPLTQGNNDEFTEEDISDEEARRRAIRSRAIFDCKQALLGKGNQ